MIFRVLVSLLRGYSCIGECYGDALEIRETVRVYGTRAFIEILVCKRGYMLL